MPGRPIDGAVLIIDDDAMFRDAVVAQLAHAGCATLAAESYEEGCRLCAHHADVRVIVLDHPTVDSRIGEMVSRLRQTRPEATVIGNSGFDRRAEFAAAGVEKYLQKPWRVAELIRLLRRYIEACVGCGRPLPLRLPEPGETGSSWVCASCGARYYAVFDEAAPADLRRDVIPASRV